MIFKKARKGYILLISVLTLGTVSSASAIAILLLGLSVERNAFSIQLSTQAFSGAQSCIERAIAELREDLEYEGNEALSLQYAYDSNGSVAYDTYTCIIYPIGGDWNENRTICAEATFGNYTTRRFEINLARVLPDTLISSWEEVNAITACSDYTPPFCGDEDVDSDEQCDDGGTCVGGGNDGADCDEQSDCPGGACTPQDNDGCSAACQNEFCGDSIVQSSEDCDPSPDGIENSASCNLDCSTPACGDGILNTSSGTPNEECDDGGTAEDDGCNATCEVETCGDGIWDSGGTLLEGCDDGDNDNGDGCDENCVVEECGNNLVQAGEECDDGNTANNDGCSSTCQNEICGDNIVQTDEDCDPSPLGSENSASCDSDCSTPTCGDGILNTSAGSPNEQCDDGDTDSGDGCSSTCQVEECGNGVIDSGEECDDGDTDNNDGCSSTCQNEICGDSIVQSNEDCDPSPDGAENSASCNNDCSTPACGDGILNTSSGTPAEECDDGDTDNEDGCDSQCQDEFCGDGTTQSSEECDDGGECVGGSNDGSTCDETSDCPGGTCTPQSGDGCSSTCETETSSPSDYIAYWKFDESGDPQDSSGNGHHGDIKGGAGTAAACTDINFTNALSRDFDGSNDRIRINNSSDLFPSDMSVSFWTKNDVTPSHEDGIACKTNGSTWSKGWGFYYHSSSEVRFFVQNYSSNYAAATIGDPTDWYHVVGTYDGTTLKLYINGVEGYRDDTYSGSINRTRYLDIGRCGHNNYNINGQIDDFRIYDRILSSTEIGALAGGN